jgi:Tfp pilus assembly protein PilF
MNSRLHLVALASAILAVTVGLWIALSGNTPAPGQGGYPVRCLSAFYQAGGYWEMDQHKTAAGMYRALLEDGCDDPAVHANLAASYLMTQQPKEADLASAHAVDVAGDHTGVVMIRAAALQANQRFDDAIALLQECVKAHPDHVQVRHALIHALNASDAARHTEAVSNHHREVLKHVPRNLAALLEAAQRAALAGDLAEASALFTRVLAIIGEPPPQAAAVVARFSEDVAAGNDRDVVRTITITRNLLKQTNRFRADILELGPPGGGVPGTVPHPITSLQAAPSDAIEATVRFVDVTQSWSPLAALRDRDIVNLTVGTITADCDVAIYAVGRSSPGRLLAWEGEGFEDVTDRTGLGKASLASAARFCDLDNDRRPDLMLFTPDGPHVWRATQDGRFENATSDSGFAAGDAQAGGLPFDFDQDGDLDLLMWNATGVLRNWRNDGTGRFDAMPLCPGLPSTLPGVQKAEWLDLDDDGDLDVVMWAHEAGKPPVLKCYSNERLVRFAEVSLPQFVGADRLTSPPIIEDVDHDGWLDILDVRSGAQWSSGKDFFMHPSSGRRSHANARSGVAADIDADGRMDIIAVNDDGSTSLPGVQVATGHDVIPVDYDADGRIDLLTTAGQLFRNDSAGTGNWLNVGLHALIVGDSRFNAFGLGSTVEIRAGAHYQKRTVRGVRTYFGLGPHQHADVLRVVWPNGNYQNLLFRASDTMGLAANQVVVEEQSLKGSCPYLYAWNGREFEFVTDVLWRSALGMSIGSGILGHHGSADDYFKIRADQLRPREGRYVLQFTEELWETAYFDYCRLLVVDHPAVGDIFVDEKCLSPPYPPLKVYPVVEPRALRSAVDDLGRHHDGALAALDGRYVTDMVQTRYQGVVEPHDLILDVGEFDSSDEVHLFLRGWLWPTDASTNVAVSQNSAVPHHLPTLEVVDGHGQWQPVDMAVGFPSGKSKTIVLDLSGRFLSDDHRVKLSTTFAIYWDHAFVTVGPQALEMRVTDLPVVQADLHERGYSHAFRRHPHGPVIPQYDSIDSQRQWRDLVGDYTRCGPVTELLTARDDRYVITAAGDEVTLEFDATTLPQLPDGWVRDFVIHTDGWLKDGDLNSATGKTVGPLPFSEMSTFPYPRAEVSEDPGRLEYERAYNTRRIDQSRFRGHLRAGGE